MIKKIILYFLFPIFMFLSFSPFHFGFLYTIIFALVLLFLKDKSKKYIYFSFVFIYTFLYILIFHWFAIINIDFPVIIRILIIFGTILLSSIIGLLLSLPFLFIEIKKKTIYLLPLFVASMEFLSSIENNTAFLWITPAHSLLDYLPLIQFANIGGSYIISAIIIYWAIFIYKTIVFENKKSFIINLSLLIGTFLFVFIYGKIQLSKEEYGPVLNIAIVQPNIVGEAKGFDETSRVYRENKILNYLKHIENKDLIIFPETASPVYLQRNTPFRQALIDYVKEHHSDIIIGSLRLKYDIKKRIFKYYNSAYLINDSLAFYDKVRPLGFAERLPFDDKLTFLRKIPLGQGDFSPGKSFKIFSINDIKFAVYICFESVFPTMAAKFVRNGAEFLINISEDIWFKGGIGPYQHFALGIFRAVENNRYILRSSNPGISAIIDTKGRIVKSLPIYTDGIIEGKIIANDKLTFYTKFDNIVPKLFILFLIIFYAVKYIWRIYGKHKG